MFTLPKRVAFRQEFTGNFVLDRLQRLAQQVNDALNQTNEYVGALPFANGVWVRGFQINTVTSTVTHNLGRVPVGYICTKRNAAVTFGDAVSQPSDQTKQYGLIASGSSVVVDLYFF
ncbi:hypothetical protein AKJ09_03666 [Labilithrix luteola]|uniref:Uncharacterized protein n=1 Tax=Labilithrix luteola TaxID=1391654 RepID=A0A0K1PU06_9BACT|nr:hypothetical protein [Labilithrix luteola]AKU97002.1 hypothetical protein AKJ09_03666 [Labilithrix luteola]